MQARGNEALKIFSRPEPGRLGYLVFGADSMRVALRRQELVAALVGPGAEDEMRLARIAASELRQDPAALSDALRARGFFPGPRAVLLEGATETQARTILAAVEDWAQGDATLVITAGDLRRSSGLRKAFESHKNAYALEVLAEPPGKAEIEAICAAAGLGAFAPGAMEDLNALAQALDPGDFANTVEKLALYMLSAPGPVRPDDISAIAPASVEAEVWVLAHAVAEGQAARIGPLISRLTAQGTSPVTLAIEIARHFRTLYAAALSPGGAAEIIARSRVEGPAANRVRMARQAEAWGAGKLETALRLLVETDLTLRSASRAPQMALVERALVKLAFAARL